MTDVVDRDGEGGADGGAGAGWRSLSSSDIDEVRRVAPLSPLAAAKIADAALALSRGEAALPSVETWEAERAALRFCEFQGAVSAAYRAAAIDGVSALLWSVEYCPHHDRHVLRPRDSRWMGVDLGRATPASPALLEEIRAEALAEMGVTAGEAPEGGCEGPESAASASLSSGALLAAVRPPRAFCAVSESPARAQLLSEEE